MVLPEVVGKAPGVSQLCADEGAGSIEFGLVRRPFQRLVADLEGLRVPFEDDQAAGELPEEHRVLGSPLETPLQMAGGFRDPAQAVADAGLAMVTPVGVGAEGQRGGIVGQGPLGVAVSLEGLGFESFEHNAGPRR